MYEDWDFDYYISYEFFFDSSPNDFNQDRAKVGLSKQVTPSLNMGLYYMYWTIEGKVLYKANVIGTVFLFTF